MTQAFRQISSTMQAVSWPAIFLIVVAVSLAGCEVKTKTQPVALQPASEIEEVSPGKLVSPEPPTVDDSQALAAIRAAGGEAKTGGDGLIVEVIFRDAPISDKAAESISGLTKLTKLSIYTSEMTDAGWKSLGSLGSVEHFDVRNCQVNNTQLVAAASGMPDRKSVV